MSSYDSNFIENTWTRFERVKRKKNNKFIISSFLMIFFFFVAAWASEVDVSIIKRFIRGHSSIL